MTPRPPSTEVRALRPMPFTVNEAWLCVATILESVMCDVASARHHVENASTNG
jgi:hypothetical protein